MAPTMKFLTPILSFLIGILTTVSATELVDIDLPNGTTIRNGIAIDPWQFHKHYIPVRAGSNEDPYTQKNATWFWSGATETMCDIDNNRHENLTGIRGEGDAFISDCQTLLGWTQSYNGMGFWQVFSGEWSPYDYTPIMGNDRCAFGIFRMDAQDEPIKIGGNDVKQIVTYVLNNYWDLNKTKTEADGFLYCEGDSPIGWGVYNMNARAQNQQDQSDY